MNGEKNTSKDLYHLGLLIALIIILWFVTSWFFGCKIIPVPYSCDAYWGITRFPEGGKARVLIVFGKGGLGNHQLLEETLQNPSNFGARPESMQLSKVTIGNLQSYDLVIVEEARKMSTAELKMFMDYASLGGRLVWTGDAGTELETGDQLLYEYERPNGTDENKNTNPWARKLGNQAVAFDQFISVNYVGNFCTLVNCNGVPQTGAFSAPDRTHPLVKAIRPNLKMFGNFAVVDTRKDSYSKEVLSADTQSDIISNNDTYSDTYNPKQFPECSDQKDNDNDGRIDWNGLDTTGDGTPDIAPDPGCTSPQDDTEGGTTPAGTGQNAQCEDSLDNDRDGKIDYPLDSCCVNAKWDNEESCTENLTQCSNGNDDDKDGQIDYPNDPGCISTADNSEGARNLGKNFPIIVTTGIGEKVAYYSIPPEFFVSDQMPIDPTTGERYSYMSLLQNMYYGMIQ